MSSQEFTGIAAVEELSGVGAGIDARVFELIGGHGVAQHHQTGIVRQALAHGLPGLACVAAAPDRELAIHAHVVLLAFLGHHVDRAWVGRMDDDRKAPAGRAACHRQCRSSPHRYCRCDTCHHGSAGRAHPAWRGAWRCGARTDRIPGRDRGCSRRGRPCCAASRSDRHRRCGSSRRPRWRCTCAGDSLDPA